METMNGHRALTRALSATAVALGNFDGVHAGHRELLRRAASASGASDAIAYTFEPHPAQILAPQLAPKSITSLARRLELIEATGIDVCVVEPFNRELASLAPETFFTEIITGALGASTVIVGYDFTFGHKRSGTTETLVALGAEHGVSVDIVEPVTISGIVASSTKVRNFLADGNLAGARLLLGRDYDIDGVVVTGEKRGRELGFPTANIMPDVEVIAPAGIYSAWVEVLDGEHAGTRKMAATSLGTNPTFDGASQRTLEPHLLDFDGDLYGARLRVEFVEYLRPEQRYPSIDDLVRAIDEDIEKTRRSLGEQEKEPRDEI